MAKLTVNVVSAERQIYSDQADMVIAPGSEGELGILPQHAALLTLLSVGELRIKNEGREHAMVLSGGFLEVANDRVTILADVAERAEDIDVARAEAARERAVRALSESVSTTERAAAELALRRAVVRLRVGRRRRQPESGRG